ncbi:MAG: NAD-dependent epimerase/dehydratase family protein [Candidatus Omnitrophota bacterium]
MDCKGVGLYAPTAYAGELGTTPLPNPISAKIPRDIGTIEETYTGPSGRTVILIQDAHAIPDAQRHIRSLIDYFQKEYGLETVAVEGVASPMDPQIFRSFPDRERLEKVFGQYMEDGELTGAAAAAVLNDRSARYLGIENWDLYEEGTGLYLKAMAMEPGISERLKARDEKLRSDKEKNYSPQLLEIDRVLESFRANQASLDEVLLELSEARPPEPGTDLALMADELIKSSQEVSPSAAMNAEVRRLAGQVKQFLQGENGTVPLTVFNEKFQDYQISRMSGEALSLFLQELIAEAGLPVTIPESLKPDVTRQKQMRDIEGTRFFRDFERYVRSVKESLFRNDAERKLDHQTRVLHLLGRLNNLELTREEWESLKRTVPAAQNTFQSHLAFYRNAEKREHVLYANLLRLFPKGTVPPVPGGDDASHSVISTPPQAGEKSPSTILAVLGGFHSLGMTRLLKEKGISYVLVRPQINSLPGKSSYRDQMKGAVSWESYFRIKNGKINLYDAFVCAARNRLLDNQSMSFRATAQTGEKSQVRDFSSPLGQGRLNEKKLLKRWRDQILFDLMKAKRIESAGNYTPFLDEAVESPSEADWHPAWMTQVRRFIENLRGLDRTGKLTEQNVLNLLQPSTITAQAPAGALAPRAESRVLVGVLIPPGGRESGSRRSESRVDEAKGGVTVSAAPSGQAGTSGNASGINTNPPAGKVSGASAAFGRAFAAGGISVAVFALSPGAWRKAFAIIKQGYRVWRYYGYGRRIEQAEKYIRAVMIFKGIRVDRVSDDILRNQSDYLDNAESLLAGLPDPLLSGGQRRRKAALLKIIVQGHRTLSEMWKPRRNVETRDRRPEAGQASEPRAEMRGEQSRIPGPDALEALPEAELKREASRLMDYLSEVYALVSIYSSIFAYRVFSKRRDEIETAIAQPLTENGPAGADRWKAVFESARRLVADMSGYADKAVDDLVAKMGRIPPMIERIRELDPSVADFWSGRYRELEEGIGGILQSEQPASEYKRIQEKISRLEFDLPDARERLALTGDPQETRRAIDLFPADLERITRRLSESDMPKGAVKYSNLLYLMLLHGGSSLSSKRLLLVSEHDEAFLRVLKCLGVRASVLDKDDWAADALRSEGFEAYSGDLMRGPKFEEKFDVTLTFDYDDMKGRSQALNGLAYFTKPGGFSIHVSGTPFQFEALEIDVAGFERVGGGKGAHELVLRRKEDPAGQSPPHPAGEDFAAASSLPVPVKTFFAQDNRPFPAMLEGMPDATDAVTDPFEYASERYFQTDSRIPWATFLLRQGYDSSTMLRWTHLADLIRSVNDRLKVRPFDPESDAALPEGLKSLEPIARTQAEKFLAHYRHFILNLPVPRAPLSFFVIDPHRAYLKESEVDGHRLSHLIFVNSMQAGKEEAAAAMGVLLTEIFLLDGIPYAYGTSAASEIDHWLDLAFSRFEAAEGNVFADQTPGLARKVFAERVRLIRELFPQESLQVLRHQYDKDSKNPYPKYSIIFYLKLGFIPKKAEARQEAAKALERAGQGETLPESALEKLVDEIGKDGLILPGLRSETRSAEAATQQRQPSPDAGTMASSSVGQFRASNFSGPVILGGSGFIGSNLAESLAAQGMRVAVPVRAEPVSGNLANVYQSLAPESRGNLIGVSAGHLLDPMKWDANPQAAESLKEDILSKASVILHFLAQVNTKARKDQSHFDFAVETFVTNVFFTKILARFARELGKPVIYTSSLHAFSLGTLLERPVEEPATETTAIPFWRQTRDFMAGLDTAFDQYIDQYLSGRSTKSPKEFTAAYLREAKVESSDPSRPALNFTDMMAAVDDYEAFKEANQQNPQAILEKLKALAGIYPPDLAFGIYSISKIMGEKDVLGLAPGKGAVFRLANQYGHRARKGVLPLFMTRLKAGQPVGYSGHRLGFFNVTDTVDTVETVMRQMLGGEHPVNGIIHVAPEGGPVPMLKALGLTARALRIRLDRYPGGIKPFHDFPNFHLAEMDHAKMRSVRGGAATVPLRQGLREMAAERAEMRASISDDAAAEDLLQHDARKLEELETLTGQSVWFNIGDFHRLRLEAMEGVKKDRFIDVWKKAWERSLEISRPFLRRDLRSPIPYNFAFNTAISYDPSMVPVRELGKIKQFLLPDFPESDVIGSRRETLDENEQGVSLAFEFASNVLMEDPMNEQLWVMANRWPKSPYNSLLVSKRQRPQRMTSDLIPGIVKWVQNGVVLEFHRRNKFVGHFHAHLFPEDQAPVAAFAGSFASHEHSGRLRMGSLAEWPVPHIALASEDPETLDQAIAAMNNLLEGETRRFNQIYLRDPATRNLIALFFLFRSDEKMPFGFSTVGFVRSKDENLTEEDVVGKLKEKALVGDDELNSIRGHFLRDWEGKIGARHARGGQAGRAEMRTATVPLRQGLRAMAAERSESRETLRAAPRLAEFENLQYHYHSMVAFTLKGSWRGETYYIKFNYDPKLAKREIAVYDENVRNEAVKDWMPEVSIGQVNPEDRRILAEGGYLEQVEAKLSERAKLGLSAGASTLPWRVREGSPYIVLKEVEMGALWETLREDLVAFFGQPEKDSTKSHLIDVFLKVFEVVEKMNLAGVVHRDLSVREIFVDRWLTAVKILDWHLAVTPQNGLSSLQDLDLLTAGKPRRDEILNLLKGSKWEFAPNARDLIALLEMLLLLPKICDGSPRTEDQHLGEIKSVIERAQDEASLFPALKQYINGFRSVHRAEVRTETTNRRGWLSRRQREIVESGRAPLLVSDLDATIKYLGGRISDRAVRAIYRYTAGGGYYAPDTLGQKDASFYGVMGDPMVHTFYAEGRPDLLGRVPLILGKRYSEGWEAEGGSEVFDYWHEPNEEGWHLIAKKDPLEPMNKAKGAERLVTDLKRWGKAVAVLAAYGDRFFDFHDKIFGDPWNDGSFVGHPGIPAIVNVGLAASDDLLSKYLAPGQVFFNVHPVGQTITQPLIDAGIQTTIEDIEFLADELEALSAQYGWLKGPSPWTLPEPRRVADWHWDSHDPFVISDPNTRVNVILQGKGPGFVWASRDHWQNDFWMVPLIWRGDRHTALLPQSTTDFQFWLALHESQGGWGWDRSPDRRVVVARAESRSDSTPFAGTVSGYARLASYEVIAAVTGSRRSGSANEVLARRIVRAGVPQLTRDLQAVLLRIQRRQLKTMVRQAGDHHQAIRSIGTPTVVEYRISGEEIKHADVLQALVETVRNASASNKFIISRITAPKDFVRQLEKIFMSLDHRKSELVRHEITDDGIVIYHQGLPDKESLNNSASVTVTSELFPKAEEMVLAADRYEQGKAKIQYDGPNRREVAARLYTAALMLAAESLSLKTAESLVQYETGRFRAWSEAGLGRLTDFVQGMLERQRSELSLALSA